MKHLEIIHQLGQADSREAAVAFDEFPRGAVRQSLVSVMAEEVTSLCGAAHGRDTESPSRRAGSAPSSLEIEGEKISRPRVRREHSDGTKSEVKLASYEAAKGYEKNKIRDAIIRAYTHGVSTNEARDTIDWTKGASSFPTCLTSPSWCTASTKASSACMPSSTRDSI